MVQVYSGPRPSGHPRRTMLGWPGARWPRRRQPTAARQRPPIPRIPRIPRLRPAAAAPLADNAAMRRPATGPDEHAPGRR